MTASVQLWSNLHRKSQMYQGGTNSEGAKAVETPKPQEVGTRNSWVEAQVSNETAVDALKRNNKYLAAMLKNRSKELL